MNKNKLIALNKKFHGYEDVEEDNEPEYIESDFGDLIINPKYNNDKDIKNAQAKLKQYENEYNLLNNNDVDADNNVIDIQDVETKLKQYGEEYKDKQEYYNNVIMN